MIAIKPKLRFPEFSDNWIQNKLGDISDKIGSGNTPSGGEKVYQKSGIIFIRSQNVNENQLKLDDVTFISEEINSKMKGSLVQSNDILLNITGASLGRSCVVPNNFIVGNVNQHVCIIRLNSNNNSRFIQSFLSSSAGEKLIDAGQTGSGREGLNFQSIRGFNIFTPTLSEQTKIANFLTAVNEKIQALKEKKKLLEEYKKGLMQKIFSQEIRFKQDDGSVFPDWEENRLEKICKITIGEFVIKTRQNPNGKYPVFNGGKTYTGFYDEFNNEGNKIIISARGANAGFVNFQSEKFWAGNSCYSISVKDENIHSIKYFYFYIKKFENRFLENQQAANIPSVSKKDAEMFEIEIPSLFEQQKIASFLSSIDTKIEKVGHQIEGAQAFKKGLLQQMFV